MEADTGSVSEFGSAGNFLETAKSFGTASFTTAEFVDRYKTLFPDAASALAARYGRGGKGSGHPYSANSRYGSILGLLFRAGAVQRFSYEKAPPNWGNAVIRRWAFNNDIDDLASLPALGLGKSSMRNPSWNRDELILALHLYMTNPANPPGKESPAVANVSTLLNKMHRLTGGSTNETFRNPNGVYLKMMNFRALDPTHTAQGKVGMKSGGKLDQIVWDEYSGRLADLAADAHAIRHAVEQANEVTVGELPTLAPYEAQEGGVVLRLHKRYERDRKLVAEKLKAAKAAGPLACEVCSFDYGKAYGELGTDFIEVHHLSPVHSMKPGQKTKLTDLALLCANCHRMAHRKRSPLGLEALHNALSSTIVASSSIGDR